MTKQSMFAIAAMILAAAGTAFGAVPFRKGFSDNTRGQKATKAEQVPQAKELLNEDFSAFSAGTETEPGDEIEYDNGYWIPEILTSTPGWTGAGLRPAGGSVALTQWVYNDEPRGGYISTPRMNLAGTATLTFRAKAKDAEGAELWVAMCDDYYTSGEDQADYVLNEQWTTFTLTATKGSFEDPSYFQFSAQSGIVLLDDIRIEFVRDRLPAPYALDAVNISPTEFKAVWEGCDVPTYRLNVFSKTEPDNAAEGSMYQSFDEINVLEDGCTIDASNPNYPQGWIINLSEGGSRDVIRTPGDYCSAPQALVMDDLTDVIETETFPMPIDGFVFWIKPSVYDDSETYMSLLKVEIYHSETDKWEAIAHVPYYWMDKNGGDYEFEEEALGNDATRIRFSVVQKGKVDFYIDELAVHYRERGKRTEIVKNLDLSDTEYTISDIDPKADYYYYVQAVDGELISEPSYVVWVDGIKGLSPQHLEPTNVTKTGFTANWQQLGHATDYKVDGFRVTTATEDMQDVVILEEAFDGITEGTPENPGTDYMSTIDFGAKGWTTTAWGATQPAWAAGMAGTQGTSWFGLAGLVYTPAMNLSGCVGQGFDVEASLYTTVDRFTTQDGKGYAEGVYVMLLNSPMDTQPLAWGIIETPTIGLTHGTTHVDIAEGTDVSNVIIAFMNMSGTMFFVDNAKFTQNLKAENSLMTPIMSDVTTETKYTFSDLDPTCDYGYIVTASTTHEYQPYVSNPSELKIVKTSQSTVNTIGKDDYSLTILTLPGSINVKAVDNAMIRIYNVNGTCVAQSKGTAHIKVPAGIYIVTANGESRKVVVK